MKTRRWNRPRLAATAFLLTITLVGMSYGAGADAADAAQKKDIDALRMLTRQRADVNAAQPDGTTALHWAVLWNNEEAVNLLLRAGADATAREICWIIRWSSTAAR